MIGRGSTGGFSGRAVSPSPADRRLGGAPFIPEPRQQYEVQEVDHDDGDVDAYDIKTPVQARPSTSVIHSKNERVDSWSSTAAIRGDAPSRSSSLGATTWSDEPDSIENLRIKLPLSRQPTVSAVTEAQTRLNSNTLPSNAGDTNEASDALGPLPSTSSASTNKRVHFTPSVVGGLSSIASSSPPPSPSSVADIPLPPSTDSDASDDTSA
ncbi:hypothetical protein BS47DRAFT_1091140 [Hydnum rufescens UP504]|uniref:Uncharacterized protein n=1 Tax=Hydnum rufescens UP504 TaxID=1448309 RepID=A0A9P6DV47_9AGAM|nr:hypothetical protein BS47DRAFT_1091140 [Hydnum rufescens UP504]